MSALTESPATAAPPRPPAFNRLLVTGDAYFLRRFRYLTAELGTYAATSSSIATPPVHGSKLWRRVQQWWHRVWGGRGYDPATFYKNGATFIRRSRLLEQQIYALNERPDHVFHVFGMCVPLWDRQQIPFSMLIDFTMDMCCRLYGPWGLKDPTDWIAAEREGYHKAAHIFTAGSDVKRSLVQVYGVPPENVTVTGLPGVFPSVYEGPKEYGSQQLLFYNLEFHRKGGDRVLAAFAQLRAALPNARLIVIGERDHIPDQPGVENRGWQSLEQLQELFLTTDLIIAPARCEPFGQFMVEAMNFGIPCIATAQEGNGIADFIDHNHDGLLVHDPTPEQLADLAVQLLRDRERLAQLGSQARKKVRTTLTSAAVAATMMHKIAPAHV